jgi:1A family penicillin-binding protein
MPNRHTQSYKKSHGKSEQRQKRRKASVRKRPREQKANTAKGNRFVAFIKQAIPFLFKIGVLIGLVCTIAFMIYVALISRDLPSTDGLITRNVVESTKIYDRSGDRILYEIHGDEKRTEVEVSDLPAHVPNAFIAIEDKDYYSHNGLLPKRVIKAIYDDVMHILKVTFIPKSIRETLGIRLNKIQGASTITQQLVKNAILTPEKKITRKLKEMILAWQLERRFTKEQILKMYLNEISYGGVNYGIESAAQSYFAKPASELTIAESAIMAAMINAPSRLSPYGNYKDELIARQQFVIKLMRDQGLITQDEYEEAIAQELVFKQRRESILAPHFVMYVREILEEKFSEKYSEQLLTQGGLRIYTTLDLDIQRKAEAAIKDNDEIFEANGASNAAIVGLDPKTGQVLAMVGSRDYFDTENSGNFNAALGNRQPGSSMKPFVYLLGFQKGFFPESVVFDVNTDFSVGGESYTPKNYDLKESGAVTLRESLARSLNIPAVKMLYLTGLDMFVEYAQKLGYTTLSDKDRYGLSVVLGGAEVKLLEHAGAYGAFANDGVYNEPSVLLRVEDRNGEVLEEFEENGKRVFDVNAARMLSSVLSDNVARSATFGLQNVLVVPNRQVAAKTGTTNDYRDGWLMGYTPSFVGGVWVGNNDNSKMNRGSGGSKAAGPIWNSFMTEVLKDMPNEPFTAAPENTSDNPALNGQLKSGVKLKIDTISGKLATENTPEDLVEEKTFRQVNSVLHYVDKEDPTAGIPENPSKDSQYENWQNAILDWVRRFNEKANESEDDDLIPIEIDEPPTEYDDTHTLENRPSLTILSPVEGQTIISPDFSAEVITDAPRGVAQVTYLMDGREIGSSWNAPFNISTGLRGVQNGVRELTVRSCDDVKNCTEQTINLNINLSFSYADIDIISPQNGETFSQDNFGVYASLHINDASEISAINAYVQSIIGEEFIGSISNVQSGLNTFLWDNNPGSGGYNLIFEQVNTNGDTFRTQSVYIEIE